MKSVEGSAECKSEANRIRVADLQIDLQKRTVCREGRKLPVKGRSFQLLQHLIERYPETASHSELMAAIWKGVVVTPATLAQRVRLLRKALGHSGDGEGYIVSVHGQGYRVSERPQLVDFSTHAVSPQFSNTGAVVLAVIAFVVCIVLLTSVQHNVTHWLKHFVKHNFG
jgi:DNA-binding winged helix-turn-helix (wHTH) protein